MKVTFKPSDVHQGHYVYINGVSTDIVVNLFAYETISEYKDKVDEEIKKVVDEQGKKLL
jgi:hypothetical protein